MTHLIFDLRNERIKFAHVLFFQGRNSNRSLNISVSRLSDERSDSSRKSLFSSDSWTCRESFNHYDEVDKLDRLTVSLNDKESSDRKSGCSDISVENSIYENWTPKRRLSPIELPNRSPHKSLLIEFDPLSSPDDESLYCNFQNNDLMLLQSLLAGNEWPFKSEDNDDFVDEEESLSDEEQINKDNQVTLPIPKPPRRFDSLTKKDCDEMEAAENNEKVIASDKSQSFMRPLSSLRRLKQAFSTRESLAPIVSSECLNDSDTIRNSSKQSSEQTSPTPSKSTDEPSKLGNVVQRLRRFKDRDSPIGPQVMNLVKKGSKYLIKNRESRIGIDDSVKCQSLNMIKPKIHTVGNLMGHRGDVFTGNGLNIDKMNPRVAILSDQKLSFYSDKTMTNLKEVVDIDTINSIHLLKDVK